MKLNLCFIEISIKRYFYINDTFLLNTCNFLLGKTVNILHQKTEDFTRVPLSMIYSVFYTSCSTVSRWSMLFHSFLDILLGEKIWIPYTLMLKNYHLCLLHKSTWVSSKFLLISFILCKVIIIWTVFQLSNLCVTMTPFFQLQ